MSETNGGTKPWLLRWLLGGAGTIIALLVGILGFFLGSDRSRFMETQKEQAILIQGIQYEQSNIKVTLAKLPTRDDYDKLGDKIDMLLRSRGISVPRE